VDVKGVYYALMVLIQLRVQLFLLVYLSDILIQRFTHLAHLAVLLVQFYSNKQLHNLLYIRFAFSSCNISTFCLRIVTSSLSLN